MIDTRAQAQSAQFRRAVPVPAKKRKRHSGFKRLMKERMLLGNRPNGARHQGRIERMESGAVDEISEMYVKSQTLTLVIEESDLALNATRHGKLSPTEGTI